MLIVLLLALAFPCEGHVLPAQDLRVEYMPSPVRGLDVTQPRFSWRLTSDGARSVFQTSLELHVCTLADSTDCQNVANMWNFTAESNQTSQWQYAGKDLSSDRSYLWVVRWRDSHNTWSPWSAPAFFDTGLLAPSDWRSAQWIGGANQLRTAFNVSSVPSRGRLYICGLGYYVAFINGRRVGDARLGAFTTFQQRVLYDTYDVTGLLRAGENVIGVALGHGWYAQPSVKVGPRSLIAQLSIVASTETFVVSSTSWKVHNGPVVSDDIYIGEDYDARLETTGWNSAGFDDSSWSAATAESAPSANYVLSAQLMPVIRKVESFSVLSLTEPAPGVYVADFGQNMAGWARLRVKGPRGTNVTLQYSEMVDPQGFVVRQYSNSPMIDHYVLKGGGHVEEYEPTFTYHGFQYVQVTGYPGIPDVDALQAYFVHSDLPVVGAVTSSHEVMNAVQHLTQYASLCNYMSIPTDCPQRERRGWMGDAQLSAETTIHNWDMAAAYTKFVRDMHDQQVLTKTGAVADCVPWYHHGALPADPAWGTAYTLITNWMFEYYDDKRLVESHYDGIKTYVDYMVNMRNGTTGLLDYSLYGDWFALFRGANTYDYKSPLVSTFYLLLQCRVLGDMAILLGKSGDSAKYKQLAVEIGGDFNKWLLNATTHKYLEGWQTWQLLPLVLGIVESDQRADVENILLNSIVNEHDTHMLTGIVGTKYLLGFLGDIGRSDLAQELAVTDSYPSWGFQWTQGATTLWEDLSATRFVNVGSRNHIMFGGQGAWYYRHLCGIQRGNGQRAYEDLVIAPEVPSWPNPNISFASASLRTIRGRAASSWALVPAVCTAAPEGPPLQVACDEGLITHIEFASFGTPSGDCGNYTAHEYCNMANSTSVVEKLCVGKASCSVPTSTSFWGDPCPNVFKQLVVQVGGCTRRTILEQNATVPTNSKGTVFVPTLGYHNISVADGTSIVWANGKFVGGVDGITSGSATTSPTGAAAIAFQVASGAFQFTVQGVVGTVMQVVVKEGDVMKIGCKAGRTIANVVFAAYGVFARNVMELRSREVVELGSAPPLGECVYGSSKAVVERHCLHRTECTMTVTKEHFGDPNICQDTDYRPLPSFLIARFMCSAT